MEVILRQAVEKLGHTGDVVSVSNGYGRDYLLPRGPAYLATERNKRKNEQQRPRVETAEGARRGSAGAPADKLEPASHTFSARVGEGGELFGSVTSSDIAAQLAAQGL